MEKKNIEEILEKFTGLSVLIVGDAMIDSYLWGKTERISPEAPVPIITVGKQENRLGGAANVSLNVQALGATPILVAVIGDDEKGRIFSNLMEENKLADDAIFIDNSRITTVKTRIISGRQQIARFDQETTLHIDSQLEKKILEKIKSIINEKQIHAIIFVDYDKGLITPWLIDNIIKEAKSKNIITVADPKIRNFNNYRGIDLFKPNFKEFTEGLNIELEKTDIQGLTKVADDFRKKMQVKLLFVTLSELGVFVINGVGQNYFPAEIRDIADVSGAGDTVVATASLCLAAGLPVALMAQLSNMAGGLVCEKLGVVPIDLKKLKKEAKKIQTD